MVLTFDASPKDYPEIPKSSRQRQKIWILRSDKIPLYSIFLFTDDPSITVILMEHKGEPIKGGSTKLQ